MNEKVILGIYPPNQNFNNSFQLSNFLNEAGCNVNQNEIFPINSPNLSLFSIFQVSNRLTSNRITNSLFRFKEHFISPLSNKNICDQMETIFLKNGSDIFKENIIDLSSFHSRFRVKLNSIYCLSTALFFAAIFARQPPQNIDNYDTIDLSNNNLFNILVLNDMDHHKHFPKVKLIILAGNHINNHSENLKLKTIQLDWDGTYNRPVSKPTKEKIPAPIFIQQEITLDSYSSVTIFPNDFETNQFIIDFCKCLASDITYIDSFYASNAVFSLFSDDCSINSPLFYYHQYSRDLFHPLNNYIDGSHAAEAQIQIFGQNYPLKIISMANTAITDHLFGVVLHGVFYESRGIILGFERSFLIVKNTIDDSYLITNDQLYIHEPTI